MAVLSKIRQRSLLLILVIGLSLLAFIITDIIKSGGFGSPSRNVGSVNGDDISAQDFRQKVSEAEQRQQGISATQASNMVWNQEVESRLFAARIEKAGIRVGRDHVLDMYSQDPSVAQNPQFQNALGKFDKNKFNDFLVNLKKTNPEQWANIEKNKPLVEDFAKRQLYITMLKAGIVTTEAEGKAKYKEENDKITFDYVMVPYNTVNDDQVKVTDQEIIDYMKKNEKKYKSEASRQIEYVLIDNKPSQADEAEMKKNIESLLQPRIEYNEQTKANDTVSGFASAANVEDFVNKNSDVKFDSTYVAKKDLPAEYAEQLYNLAPGQVFGPYIDNGFYKISKMVGKKSGISVNASHILIGYKGAKIPDPSITRTKEEAKAKADDLLKQVNANPSGFAALAAANSDDQGSKGTGGLYENVVRNQMVKPFNDFIFNNPAGKTGVVETEFGYHVIKVNSKNDGVQLATIAQRIEPSEATSDAIFTKATKMEMDAETRPFADLAKELNLTIVPVNKLLANDEQIQGIGAQRGMVRWAFEKDTKIGDVKKFDIAQGHVIARLKGINEKGVLPVDEARPQVEPILKNQKKAEIIKKKMAGNTLEAVAGKTASSVATATDVTFAAPLIQNIGSEPKVVGKAFGLAAGKTSGLIEGNMGIFMVRTKAITAAPAMKNYSAFVNRLKTEGRGSVPSRISMALRENADIEDNRFEFY